MRVLICGSIAYDTIMVFEDRFKNHILPEQVHILNVSFTVPRLRREFGGCATNIAYNLKLLGIDGVPMGTVGRDFEPYAEWLDRWGIERSYIKTIDDCYTAQAYINTDLDDNQITAFHPGAMSYSHLNRLDGAAFGGGESRPNARDGGNLSSTSRDPSGFRLGMISPDGREGMITHARELSRAGIPFIFDPGQGLILFSGEELLNFINLASWLTLNDYESKLLQELTGRDLEELSGLVEALVVTRGGEGSLIYTDSEVIEIPPARVREVQDPTGCGDAYRAGLIFGLLHELDWPTTGRVASLMGAVKIEHHGTQNHVLDLHSLEMRFRDSFGYSLQERLSSETA